LRRSILPLWNLLAFPATANNGVQQPSPRHALKLRQAAVFEADPGHLGVEYLALGGGQAQPNLEAEVLHRLTYR
jgi:hypothetical protein